MATYYKYAERSADSQVNWAEVGKGISDMLSEEVAIREEKKAAYDKAYKEDIDNLANAPQGKWQDGNATVNNFAHDMMQQQLIDSKLLKSGQMKERDYTLRRENFKSQTNTLFDLQKMLQAERESTIDLYQKGEVQGLNISNMSDVEAYTDFANAKVDIDPYASNINMSIYETKMIDGKEVKVVKKTTPVNVLKGQIVQKIPTFKADENINRDVDNLGIDEEAIYKAATLSGAGTITELVGYGALKGVYNKKNDKGELLYPQIAELVKKTDDAIEATIDKYFANPYNISSVLTENTGKYNADSYIWSKEEAEKDKTKLLKKIDPLTGLTVLDDEAPHYKEQVAQAREWVKKTMLGKLDSKRTIDTTAQTQLQERRAPTEGEIGRKDREAEAANYAQNMAFLLTGTQDQVDKALQYFRGLGVDMDRNKQGVFIKNEAGNQIPFTFGNSQALDLGRSLLGGANPRGLPEDIVVKKLREFLGDKAINTSAVGKAVISKPKAIDPLTAFGTHISKAISPEDIKGLSKGKAADALNEKLAGLGVTVKSSWKINDDIYIVNADGKESPPFNVTKDNAIDAIKQWIKANPSGATPKAKKDFVNNLIKTGVIKSGEGELDE